MGRAEGGWGGRAGGGGGAALASDVDLFHGLAVLLLYLHLNGGPEEHVFALQAVLAAGC